MSKQLRQTTMTEWTVTKTSSNARANAIPILALAITVTILLSFVLVPAGEVSFAEGKKPGVYDYGITDICHKGKTITVSLTQISGHIKHGDTIGPCIPA